MKFELFYGQLTSCQVANHERSRGNGQKPGLNRVKYKIGIGIYDVMKTLNCNIYEWDVL